MAIYFISDLHLDAATPHLNELFFYFVNQYHDDIEELYILGDFFEVWVGDDNAQTEFHHQVIRSLRHLTNHIPVYIMPGNRDFLLGQRFAQQCGAERLPDPTLIELYGQPTLLMHGDRLCLQDKRHQWFRKLSRHPIAQNIFLQIPISWRQNIATRIRKQSQRYTAKLSTSAMDVPLKALQELAHHYQITQFIYGHTHRPSIHYFQANQTMAKAYVLSDWGNQGNMLICSADGTKRLSYFSLKSN